MKFSPAPPNPFYDNYNYSDRLESETGRWTIALYPVIYGIRVQAGLTNQEGFALDVCCGDRRSDIVLVYAVVKCWLEGFPEEVSDERVRAVWPRFPIKPVTLNQNWEPFAGRVSNGFRGCGS